MHYCVFPLSLTTLLKRNDNLGIVNKGDEFDFKLGSTTFRTFKNEESLPKIRITLQHKETGEVLTFDDSKNLLFFPDLTKLNSKKTDSAEPVSQADLIRTYGSTKEQKVLKEQEKLNINKDAQKAIKVLARDALKEQKVEAAKGNKLNQTYMDVNMNENGEMANLVEDHRMKLSSIAPKEVLDSLTPEAETVIDLTIDKIEKLEGSLSFHQSVIDLMKRWPSFQLEKIQYAILLEYFIRFLNLPIKTVRSKDPLPGCPAFATKFIINNFTRQVFSDDSKPTITMSKDEKDKLLLVIIGLYGYLSAYEFPISSFMVDVKSGRDRIKKIGQQIDMRLMCVNKEHFMKTPKPYMDE